MSRVQRFLEWFRPYRTPVATCTVLLAWAAAFQYGFARSEWSSMWDRAPATQGQSVSLAPKDVETTAEREKRETVAAKDLRDTYHTLKQGVLGDTRTTRGDDPLANERKRTGDNRELTPEEVCEQMKLVDPQKFGKLKCKDDDGDGY